MKAKPLPLRMIAILSLVMFLLVPGARAATDQEDGSKPDIGIERQWYRVQKIFLLPGTDGSLYVVCAEADDPGYTDDDGRYRVPSKIKFDAEILKPEARVFPNVLSDANGRVTFDLSPEEDEYMVVIRSTMNCDEDVVCATNWTIAIRLHRDRKGMIDTYPWH